MRRCIVTGATSCIGIAVVTNLLRNNYEVIGVIRPNSLHMYRLDNLKYVFKNTLKIVELDMKNIEELEKQVEGDVLCFFHCAWDGTRGDSRMSEEQQKKNYDMTKLAGQVAVKLHCTIFIGVGSQAEYGSVYKDVLQSEIYEAHPDTAYGKYKLMASCNLRKFCHEQGLRFIWGRVFSAYGPWDYSNSILESCLTSILKNEPINLSLCTQTWNFIHVTDVAEAFRRLLEHPNADGIFNLASSDTRILREFIFEMANIFRATSSLRFGTFLGGSNRLVYLRPDITKLKKTLKWEPCISFKNGILSRYKEKKGHMYES